MDQDTQNKSAGPIVGIVIIVLILVFGGLYFWGQRAVEEPTAQDVMNAPDYALDSLAKVGTSDEVPAIETDLNGTDLNNLDTELGDIDTELNK